MSTPGASTPPVGWPVYDVGFADAVKRGFKGYVVFDGRASRAEFWYWYLFSAVVALVLVVPSVAIGTASASDGSVGPVFVVGLVLAGLFYAAVLLPTIAVACRRLHDAGFSGLYLLLGLITGLIPLIMCMLPTSPSASRFGPPGQAEQPGQLYGSAAYGAPPGYVAAPGSPVQPPTQAWGIPGQVPPNEPRRD